MSRKNHVAIPVTLFFLAACLVLITATNRPLSFNKIVVGFVLAAIAYSGLLIIMPPVYKWLSRVLDTLFPPPEKEQK